MATPAGALASALPVRSSRRASATSESDDRFEVVGLWEEVETLDEISSVSVPAKRGKVPYECLRVARNVDDCPGPSLRNPVHHSLSGAGARRVQQYQVGVGRGRGSGRTEPFVCVFLD